MGKSIDGIGRRREPPPLLILSMSLQPVIPWRVALQQSPTPLHRPRPASLKTRLSASQKTSNGKGAQLKLSQLRGSPHDLVRLLRFLRNISTGNPLLLFQWKPIWTILGKPCGGNMELPERGAELYQCEGTQNLWSDRGRIRDHAMIGCLKLRAMHLNLRRRSMVAKLL